MIFGRRRRRRPPTVPPPPEPPPVSPVPLAPRRADRQRGPEQFATPDITIGEFLAHVRVMKMDTHSLTLEEVLMSMFDQDPNFEETFKEGDQLVLTALRYVGTISTRVGNAEKVQVTATTRDLYPEVKTFSALGVGFAAQAQRASADEFPQLVQYVKARTPTGNMVKRFQPVFTDKDEQVRGGQLCRAWVEGKVKTVPVIVEHADAPASAATGEAPPPGNRAGF